MVDRTGGFRRDDGSSNSQKGLVNHDQNGTRIGAARKPNIDVLGQSSYSRSESWADRPLRITEENGAPSENGGYCLLNDDVRALAHLIARRRGVRRGAMEQAVTAAEKAIAATITSVDDSAGRSKRARAAVRRDEQRPPSFPTRPRSKRANGYHGDSKRKPKPGDFGLPPLPRSLRWPTKKYAEFYKERGGNIVEFLSDPEVGWIKLLKAKVAELRVLRLIDPSALDAIKNFERRNPKTGGRNRLPEHLRFLRTCEVTDREIARQAGKKHALKGNRRLAEAVAYRLRHGLTVPGL